MGGGSDSENLDKYNPKVDHADFYKEYGEDFLEWQEHFDELVAIGKEIGYSGELTPNSYHIYPGILSPFNIYFTNKNLKKIDPELKIQDIFRKPNSMGLRSDEFTKEHHGMHIVFAGCSITFGDGLPEEFIWPKLVFNKIKEEHQVSGYYNLGFNGANHFQIFTQIWSYIEHFGNPDVLFINFPDIRRLIDAGVESRAVYIIATMYNSLHLYCKSVGIKLISFTWDTEINEGPEQFIIDQMIFQPELDPRSFFAESFHKYHVVRDRQRFMFRYHQENEDSIYKDFFIRAFDIVHPGISEHAFYADFAFKKFKEL